ncbi:MAG: DUF362 domain-containing protein [Candidatus Omnitrophica bacterium]|nr:DUF362 domain-containing protein [Candidatus Omnitrophota bacterium]
MPSDVYYIETKNDEPIDVIGSKLGKLIDASGILNFIKKDEFSGIKLHFGEEGNTGHVKPLWVREVVKKLNARTKNVFATDSNVLYKSSRRTNSVDHMKLAYEHGFDFEAIGAPLIIADGLFGKNFTEIPINKKHLSKVKIASEIASCDSLIVLSHVTAHMQTGLAGAIKNVGMGCAARRGKYEQHSGAVPDIDLSFCVGCGLCSQDCPASCIEMKKERPVLHKDSCIGCGECAVVCRTKAISIKWSETLENLQEKMVEYACGVTKALSGRIAYINFVLNVTKNCDCMAQDEPRIADDIGILASYDPVSLDKSSADLLNASCRGDVLRKTYKEIDWTSQLRYAEEAGLGAMDYNLKKVEYV